jgi:hypothetical protein
MKINYKEGLCSECGDIKLIVQKSLSLCTKCNNRRLTKRYSENRKKKQQPEQDARLNKFYREFWDSREHISFESASPLFTYHKWYVHHVLDKKDYPELMFNQDICVLLTLEEHHSWHSIAFSDRKKKLPKTYKRYLELLKKYDRNKYNAEFNSGIEAY